MTQQSFTDPHSQQWVDIEQLPGTKIISLAEPVPQGSIHRLRMTAGCVIPVHIHSCDEYVYVLKGIIETNERECTQGTFWFTPANTKNGPHKAITEVELLTIRLGPMGIFDQQSP